MTCWNLPLYSNRNCSAQFLLFTAWSLNGMLQHLNTDPGISIVRKNAVCGIWRSISSTYQSRISSSFHMEIIFSSWCDLHICRFFCVSSTPCVCVRQNLVHEMAAKIWWRYLSKKLHWYCTDCKIQWQSVYTATILARVLMLQMVACRALLIV